MDVAGHGAVQQLGRAPAGRADIHMRVGGERHEDLGQIAHRAGHVGMRVEGDGNGQVRADHGAQAAQDLALTVIVGLDHHRPMQDQEHPVPSARSGGLQQGGKQRLERCLRHPPARSRRGADHMGDIPVMGAAHIEQSGEFGIRMPLRPHGGGPVQKVAVAERLKVGWPDIERVGFMGDFCGEYGKPQGSFPSCSKRVVAGDGMARLR